MVTSAPWWTSWIHARWPQQPLILVCHRLQHLYKFKRDSEDWKVKTSRANAVTVGARQQSLAKGFTKPNLKKSRIWLGSRFSVTTKSVRHCNRSRPSAREAFSYGNCRVSQAFSSCTVIAIKFAKIQVEIKKRRWASSRVHLSNVFLLRTDLATSVLRKRTSKWWMIIKHCVR